MFSVPDPSGLCTEGEWLPVLFKVGLVQEEVGTDQQPRRQLLGLVDEGRRADEAVGQPCSQGQGIE